MVPQGYPKDRQFPKIVYGKRLILALVDNLTQILQIYKDCLLFIPGFFAVSDSSTAVCCNDF